MTLYGDISYILLKHITLYHIVTQVNMHHITLSIEYGLDLNRKTQRMYPKMSKSNTKQIVSMSVDLISKKRMYQTMSTSFFKIINVYKMSTSLAKRSNL